MTLSLVNYLRLFTWLSLTLLLVGKSVTAQVNENRLGNVGFDAVRATVMAENLYRHGRGDPSGYEEARSLFQVGALAGIPEAQFYFARMNQYGHGGPQDFSNAWEFYRLAAQNGDRRAWNNLGFMLENGQGREINQTAAHEHYLESAYRGMPGGMYNVAQNLRVGDGVDSPNWEAAARWYRLCIEAYPRYAKAWNNLGIILWEGGHGLQSDPLAAIDCFVRADILGNPHGAYNLGRRYRDGIGDFPPNPQLAEEAFVRAARRGHADGWDAAGDLYFYPRESMTSERASRALRYYLSSDETGSDESVAEIAYLYRFGPENVRHPEAAIPFLTRYAEEQRNGWAYRVLGQCYWDGVGVETDKAQALKHYREGAELGDGKSALRLGAALVRGNGAERDFEEARHWLEVALDDEQMAAVDDLGFLYENGKGVERDLDRAADYYRRGVEHDFTYSLVSLGVLHVKDQITDADLAYGVTLIERAANAGDEDAIRWMARVYREGLGGRTPNERVANEWDAKLTE
ncbi:MAG: tetratricopeptide repeat protein [Opitutales bacterium]